MAQSLSNLKSTGSLSTVGASDTLSNALLAAILGLGCLTYSSLNTNLVYGLIIVIYLIFLVYVGCQGDTEFIVPRYAVLSLGLIWVVYIVHISLTTGVTNLVESPLVRSPIFVFASLMNVFLIPKRVKVDDFFKILVFLSATIVLMGLLSYVSPYTILGLTVEPYYGSHGLLSIRKLKSVFGGPNAFSRFILGGLVSSFLLTLYSNRWYAILLLINALGVFLGYSRATVATAAIGIGLYLIYFAASKRWFQVVSVAVLLGAVILFAMVVRVIPGPEFITSINSSGRDILWRGAIEAWRQRPILGLGPGSNLEKLAPFIEGTGVNAHVHNSYLRMLMSTGIVGFTAYVYFHIRTIWTGLNLINDPATAAALVLVIVYSINQITNIFSLFGFTVTSVVLSLSFGYVLHDIAETNI